MDRSSNSRLGNLSYKQRLRAQFYGLDPRIQRSSIGFCYGFVFGSMLGLLGGLQHFGNEEIRPARRIIKVARSGTAMGAFCGVIVAVGFNLKANRSHN